MSSDKIKFDKSPLSVEQQIELLEKRGIKFYDKIQASQFLKHTHYYRLSGYWKLFEEEANVFKQNITFENVMQLYNLDKKLRNLFFSAIAEFELSLRAQMANIIADEFGIYALHDKRNFFDEHQWNSHNIELNDLVSHSEKNNPPIKHFRKTYSDKNLPIWITCELMSFGLLSKFFANLKHKNIQKKIAKQYQLPPEILKSWIRHLVTVRNKCAHHAKLFNCYFTIRPTVKSNLDMKNSGKIHDTAILLDFLLSQIHPHVSFLEHFRNIILYNAPIVK